MDTHGVDLARLSLMIQRMLDADVLRETEGAALLTESEAARRSLREGDAKAARLHVERVALFTEALVRSDALDLADGGAVIETARRIVGEDAD
jgi:hypothetical protein